MPRGAPRRCASASCAHVSMLSTVLGDRPHAPCTPTDLAVSAPDEVRAPIAIALLVLAASWPAQGPVATGRDGSVIQPLQLPG